MMPTISQLQRAAANAAKRAQQAAKYALHEAERLAKAARETAMSPTARKKLQRDLQDPCGIGAIARRPSLRRRARCAAVARKPCRRRAEAPGEAPPPRTNTRPPRLT
jgi:hypothetical protein